MHYVTCAPVLLCLLLLLHERLQWASVDAHDQWRLHKHSSSVVIIILFQVTYVATQQARTGILWPYVEFYNQGHTTVRSLLLLMHSLYSKFWDNQVIFIYILPNFYKHFLNLFLRLMVFLHYHGTVIAQILTSTCSIGGGIFLNSHAEPNTLCVVRLHFDGAGTWEKMHPVSVLLL